LFLPDGEDPDTYVRKHGKEEFEKLVRRAQTLSEFLLSELRSQSNLDTGEGRARFVSSAKPYVQKVTAPILRIQLINAVAELGRISEGEIRQLMEVPESPRFKRSAPARTYSVATNSPEWSLLYSLLIDLPMVVHIEPTLLRMSQPESKALMAIRDFFDATGEPSLPMLMDSLQGNASLEYVLQASRYGDELALNEEEARVEIQGALVRLDEFRRKAELDILLGTGLRLKSDLEAYNDKLKVYNRVRGALPPENRSLP
jgi:DNA primase